MRFAIGLIVFWITIFGIKLFLENKIKVDKKFTLLLSFTIIGLLEFIFGIINTMKIGSLLIVLLSFGYIIYSCIKKNINKEEIIKEIKNPINIVCALIFIYITVIGLNMHLTHYDNFSHWGLIVKSMFINNRLPNFENEYILFKGYQPGSACFIYFFGLLAGKTEGSMIIAHNYLIFAFFSLLFNYIGNNKKILKSLLLVALYIFIMTTSLIRFNNLLVDSLLATMLVAGLLIVYEYRNDLKKASILSSLIMVYLLVVKNVGLVLAGIICLYILYLSFKSKSLKKGIIYIVTIGIVLLSTLLIWQRHVSLVYGYLALNSKHSLSTQNMIASLKLLGKDNMLLFIKIYLKNFINLKENIPNVYMIIANAIMIILAILSKNKKKVINFLLVMDALYIGYYLVLGVMYIVSMPWEEAKTLAGYNRYMMTIVDIVIGLLIVYILNYKDKVKGFNILLLLATIVLLIPIYYNYDTFTGILGNDGYKGSQVERFDEIIDMIPKDKDKYYLYSPKSKGDYGKLHHMGVYKLLKNDCIILTKKEQLNDIEGDSYLVLFDKLDNYNELLEDKYEYVNDVVVTKKQ